MCDLKKKKKGTNCNGYYVTASGTLVRHWYVVNRPDVDDEVRQCLTPAHWTFIGGNFELAWWLDHASQAADLFGRGKDTVGDKNSKMVM